MWITSKNPKKILILQTKIESEKIVDNLQFLVDNFVDKLWIT